MLEIQIDYEMDSEDEERLAAYRAEGLDEGAAARQVAQDVFGRLGARVQLADLVDY
jgi:hypothetical protein